MSILKELPVDLKNKFKSVLEKLKQIPNAKYETTDNLITVNFLNIDFSIVLGIYAIESFERDLKVLEFIVNNYSENLISTLKVFDTKRYDIIKTISFLTDEEFKEFNTFFFYVENEYIGSNRFILSYDTSTYTDLRWVVDFSSIDNLRESIKEFRLFYPIILNLKTIKELQN